MAGLTDFLEIGTGIAQFAAGRKAARRTRRANRDLARVAKIQNLAQKTQFVAGLRATTAQAFSQEVAAGGDLESSRSRGTQASMLTQGRRVLSDFEQVDFLQTRANRNLAKAGTAASQGSTFAALGPVLNTFRGDIDAFGQKIGIG